RRRAPGRARPRRASAWRPCGRGCAARGPPRAQRAGPRTRSGSRRRNGSGGELASDEARRVLVTVRVVAERGVAQPAQAGRVLAAPEQAAVTRAVADDVGRRAVLVPREDLPPVAVLPVDLRSVKAVVDEARQVADA